MANGKARPGEIRDAIVDFLSQQRKRVYIRDIERAVSRRLGRRVPSSSVRSYLRLNTPTLFTRVARGHYQVKEDFDSVPCDSMQCVHKPVFSRDGIELFHDDCLGWLQRQSENTIHAIVTDPPYGLVEYSEEQQEKLRKGTGGVWRIPPAFDGHKRSPVPRFTTLTPEDLDRLMVFFRQWARLACRVLVPGGHVIVASNPLLSHLVSYSVGEADLERRGQIIRLVTTMRGGDRPKNAHKEFSGVSVMMRSMHEPWLVFRKPLEGRVQDNLRKWKTGGFRRPSCEKPFGDVIRSHPTGKRERAIAPHPSLKPQAFLRRLVHAVLPLGEGVILDPFAGSGSTLAAAYAIGYSCIGVEKDKTYIEMAKEAILPLAELTITQDI